MKPKLTLTISTIAECADSIILTAKGIYNGNKFVFQYK